MGRTRNAWTCQILLHTSPSDELDVEKRVAIARHLLHGFLVAFFTSRRA